MKLVSVNVGMRVPWKVMAVQTGIFKEAVEGPVRIGKLNLAGHRQTDLTVPGAEEKRFMPIPPNTTRTGGKSCLTCHFPGARLANISPRKGLRRQSFNRRPLENRLCRSHGHATPNPKANSAIAVIKKTHPAARLSFVPLDLYSLDAVRQVPQTLEAMRVPALSGLILNAGGINMKAKVPGVL